MKERADAEKPGMKKSLLVERAAAAKVPVAELIGFRVTEAQGGRAVATLEAGPKHANPMGTLHGGVLCSIADAAMGMAFASTLEQESFATVELKIHFLRPVWNAKLTAEAKVIQRGKTLGYIECDIRDENDKLIAKASSTCLALDGAKAKADG